MSEETDAAINAVADAIYPRGMLPGEDSSGGTVGSFTEAVMGVTAGLFAISYALSRIADALEERNGCAGNT